MIAEQLRNEMSVSLIKIGFFFNEKNSVHIHNSTLNKRN